VVNLSVILVLLSHPAHFLSSAKENGKKNAGRGFAPVFAFFDYFLFKQKKVSGIGEKNKLIEKLSMGGRSPSSRQLSLLLYNPALLL
jgi:hypothetical protein